MVDKNGKRNNRKHGKVEEKKSDQGLAEHANVDRRTTTLGTDRNGLGTLLLGETAGRLLIGVRRAWGDKHCCCAVSDAQM